ncbi:LysR family transcriptional regulator [Frateuria aurantia]
MMMLDHLRLFVAIVERGGLAAGGRELGLSPASVSERLAALERYYAASLLSRSTRSLRLTEEGRLVLEGARQLLGDELNLRSRVRDGTDKIAGPIRLTAPVDLGETRIVPLLDRFLAEHPDVSVDLDLSDSFVDLVARGVDFAIRYGALTDSSLKARRIGENRHVVCAAPDYLDRHGAPGHPAELAGHDCILMRFGTNIKRQWAFRIDGERREVAVKGRRIANSGGLARRWCLDGHGIAQKSVWDVQQDLDAGRLVEVLAGFALSGNALQIVYPSPQVQPRRVRALIEAIAGELTMPAAD